jgi:hypothetical protein
MELSELKPSERMIEILTPGTKQELGVRVSILHIDDERLKKLKRQFQDERNRLEARGKQFKAETIEENLNELTYAAMTGWEWYSPTKDPKDLPKFNGSVPEFNKKNVFEIFETLPWFRNQIGEEMGDDQAFFPA